MLGIIGGTATNKLFTLETFRPRPIMTRNEIRLTIAAPITGDRLKVSIELESDFIIIIHLLAD
jgi:hypothetical protein